MPVAAICVGVDRVEVADDCVGLDRIGERRRDGDLVACCREALLDPAGQHQVGDDGDDLGPLERAAFAELLANALRAAPHLHDLGPALAHLTQHHLAA